MTPIPAPHADHDPLAIAAYAAGDAEGPELDAALALVAACADCAALHHDLRSIAAALPDLPAPVRSRDFRLAPGQAATLRPAGWRRVLAPFAGPRFAFAGPLGTGLATLGIAGLLVAGAAAMPLGGASVAPVDTASGQGADGGSPLAAAMPSGVAFEKAQDGASAAPALVPAAPGEIRVSASGAPSPGAVDGAAPAGAAAPVTGPEASAAAGPEASVPGPAPLANTAGTEPAPVLPLLSGFALVAGLVTAGLRVAGRRLGAG